MLWRCGSPLNVLVFLLSSFSGAALSVNNVRSPPYSGAPFSINQAQSPLPPPEEDSKNTEMMVFRLGVGKKTEAAREANPHLCDMGDQAEKGKCLSNPNRGCMWTRLQTENPLMRIQASKQYCLPCTMDGEALPCWNIGAWVNGMKVTHCDMSCDHQQTLQQPQYTCTDYGGESTQSQCFDKGTRSGSKCMHISYKDQNGEDHGSCGPCELQGSGSWGCPAYGAEGPVKNSKVYSCVSQCAVLCSGPPSCPPTVAPPPPPPPPSPGLAKVSSPADVMLSAPSAFDEPMADPKMQVQAMKQEAMEAAGWKFVTTPPPKNYWPLIFYRSPSAYMWTTGPPPISDGPSPPSSMVQLATHEEASSLIVDRSAHSKMQRMPFLSGMRQFTKGQQ